MGLDPASWEVTLLARLVSRASSASYHHRSSWIEPAVDGVVAAGLPRGWGTTDVLEALARLQRWAHRAGHLAAADAGCQLLNIELLRRREGRPPALVRLPLPREDEPLGPQELWETLVSWEALSYGALASAMGGDSEASATLQITAELLVHYLGRADGIPVRWGRLDPTAFACEAEEMLCSRLGPTPRGFLAELLDAAAFLYAELVPRAWVCSEVALAKVEELAALSLACGADFEGGGEGPVGMDAA